MWLVISLLRESFVCFLGHNARLGCSRCLKEFPGQVGCMDYSGFDRHNWRLRCSEKHKKDAMAISC